MNEPWAIESILNGTGGGGGGGGNPIPPITNIYVPVDEWKYQDRIIDVVGFPWVADVPYPNVKASDFVSVIFGQEDAESGIFSNVCESRTDAVRIFASEKPSKRIRIDTLSGFRPNASNSIWGHITGDIQNQQDLVDFVGDSNKIETIKANGTALAIVDKAVNIPVAGDYVYGLIVRPTSFVIDVYVSPDGNDSTGTGSESKPWRTLNYAINQQNVRLFDGNKQYRIHVAPGDYSKISVSYKNNILIFIEGTVNISGDVNTITRSHIYIVGVPQTEATLNIIGTSSSSMGIRLHGNSYLHIAKLNMNISNVQYGIGSYVLASTEIEIGINTLMLERAPTNITATTAAIFESQSGLNVYADRAITVDSPLGLRLNSGYPCISIVKSITNTSGTAYTVASPAVLSINGKWVNQS